MQSGMTPSGTLLIGELLREQQELTAVERFSQKHASALAPVQEMYYRDLLPASPPGPGEQYSFEVDLDSCSGCKACVSACHSLNGLDDEETWRSVGLLQGGSAESPMLQHVTTACHHCLEPACMLGCPVNAYVKDAITGIVKHLDDQCIGCQYCTLTCPYDVPQYHQALGIVRKCDMCSDRLAASEAPACVQSCPNSAIRIKVISHQEILANSETNIFLPGAPEPHLTLPSTSYKTSKPFPRNLLPADYYRASVQHGHFALVAMLVLTQLSVGAFLVGAVVQQWTGQPFSSSMSLLYAGISMCLGFLGMGAAIFHLGRPLYAFRALLGLKTSWLSREILAFNVFAMFATMYASALAASATGTYAQAERFVQPLLWLTVASGLLGVLCSVLIYAITGRELWRFGPTLFRFLCTAILLGSATSLFVSALALSLGIEDRASLLANVRPLLVTVLLTSIVKLSSEISVLGTLWSKKLSPMKRTALLLTGDLSRTFYTRLGFGIVGGVFLPLFMNLGSSSAFSSSLPLFLCSSAILLLTCLGEFGARRLFFSAVAMPRMPGGVLR